MAVAGPADTPASPARQRTPAIDRAVAVLLLLAFVSLALIKVMSQDIWWQVKAGEWIVANGFPSTDPFSYAFPDRPWIEPRWLFCVVAYLVYAGLGVNGLLALKLVALFGAAAVLWRLEPRAPRWVVSFALACALLVAHRRFFVRPEMFTFVLLAIYLLAWQRWRQGGSITWLLLLPPLQVLWSNSHSIAILGPVTLIILVLSAGAAALVRATPAAEDEALSIRDLGVAAVVVLLVVLACLATPYGVDAVRFPFQLLSQIGSGDPLNELIDEFRSPLVYAGFNVFFVGFVVVTLLSLATFAAARSSAVAARLPLWGAFLLLSFLAYRNIALFGVVAAYAGILNLGDLAARGPAPKRLIYGCRVFCVGLALFFIPAAASDAYYLRERIGQRFGVGVSRLHFPVGALQFIEANGVPAPVLNDLGDGGYVLYRGGAKSVFVDGRLEVYGGEALRGAVRLLQTGEGFEAEASRLGIDTVLLRHRRQPGLFAYLLGSPQWAAVYYDHQSIVYVRVTERTQQLRQRFQIDWSNPPPPERGAGQGGEGTRFAGYTWPLRPDPVVLRNLASLYLDVGSVVEAQKYFERTLEILPSEESARLHLGMIYRCLGRQGEADALLLDADPERLRSIHFQRLLAQICMRLGNRQAALEALQRAADLRRIDPSP